MELKTVKMDRENAQEILKWKYEPPYDFYNNDLNEEELEELLDGSYYAIKNVVSELLGFYCMGKNAQVPKGQDFGVYIEKCMDMGLGMDPKLTGKGDGTRFGIFVLNEIEGKAGGLPIRLTVADFNKRAIHLYEKLGFVAKERFSTEAVGFITMVKDLELMN